MARRTRPSRRPRLAGLLFLVTTTSALSLSNFQFVNPSSVSFSCLDAYNQPMQTCTSRDFRSGRACSSGCEGELESLQGNLQQTCNGADVGTNTLLGQALEGNLVPLLCPNDSGGGGNPPESTESTATVTTSRIVATETLSKSIGLLSTFSPLTLTSAPPPRSTGDGLPVTVLPPQAAPSPTETTAAQTTQKSSDDTPEVNPGGSPFDLIGGSPTVSAPWTGALAVAVGITILLFR